MAILTIPDELMDRLRTAAAERGQDENQYATAALTKLLATERAATTSQEDWNLLYGPAKTVEQSFADLRAKHGIPDLSHLSREELAAQAEEALANLEPEKRAEAERLGLI